jgi:hypothetical protein
MTKRFLLAFAAAVLAAGPLSAQRSIVPGEVTRGSLSSSDPTLDDDTYYDEWAFEGRRGETVVITLRSDAFDTFLHLGSLRYGGFQDVTSDDDGGGGTNSRIEVRLPEDGLYVIRANSASRATGAYTLTLAGGRAASNAGGYETGRGERRRPGMGGRIDERGGILVAGQSVSGRLSSQDPTLDNGSYFDLYTYEGRRGERVTIDMRSTEFDAYLVIGTRGGRHGVESALSRDDDGGGNRNARIVFTLPYDGEFVIRAGSIIPGSGAYTLEVQSSLGGGYTGGQPAGGYDDEDDVHGIDSRLTGRWGLTIPGVRVDGRDWSVVTANASMGILNVDGSGAYTWRKNGRVLRGQLVPFTPRRDARAGTQYYLIDDGRDEFYVFVTSYRGDRYMQVNSRGTDRVVAHGYREGGI